jgi:hypothetical protein
MKEDFVLWRTEKSNKFRRSRAAMHLSGSSNFCLSTVVFTAARQRSQQVTKLPVSCHLATDSCLFPHLHPLRNATLEHFGGPDDHNISFWVYSCMWHIRVLMICDCSCFFVLRGCLFSMGPRALAIHSLPDSALPWLVCDAFNLHSCHLDTQRSHVAAQCISQLDDGLYLASYWLVRQ